MKRDPAADANPPSRDFWLVTSKSSSSSYSGPAEHYKPFGPGYESDEGEGELDPDADDPADAGAGGSGSNRRSKTLNDRSDADGASRL